MIYLTLIYEFLKIGLFSIGGGLATLPFLYQLSDTYGWFTHETLADMVAISESTPGPIGLNMATYVGYTTSGPLGGALASIFLLVPSVIIILFIVRILDKFKENRFVKAAFYGIRPAVTALIAWAAFGIIRITLLNLSAFKPEALRSVLDVFEFRSMALFVVLYYLLKKYNKHPVVYIGAGAVVGILWGL
ncbi:chromate transporter [Synergistales bacterium]|nr:chromate transporter [Synergistales bacterium]